MNYEIFIRRPVLTIMLNAALLVFGLIGLTRLPVRELPDVDAPVVTVLTVFPGASAEVVETEVTEPLEEAISSAESIRLITSESREQVSSISVEFLVERDPDLAAQDVRDLVARARGNLPEDIDEPVVAKQDANARPIMWVAFFSERYDTMELTRIADELVKDRLQTVPGVSSVIIGGEKKLAMRLWLDPGRMAARGVTATDVEEALRQQNVDLPSGRVENYSREMTIQTRGLLLTAGQFEDLVIRQDGTGVVRLRDIGRAQEGPEDERGIARFNGQPSVGLGIIRQSKANTLEVAAGVKRRMQELRPMLPDGVEFKFPYDESVFVSRAITEVWETLAIAFGLVVLTIFVFLRSVRSTFIPMLAIPISIGSTFLFLYLFGLSVNIFTMLALVLAIGIVVDDAIVVLENIFRHVEHGMAPRQAAAQSMKEISFAVIATSFSLVATFLPLVFLGGVTGRLLVECGVTLCVSVLVSMVVALTLSPMASARILRPAAEVRHGPLFLAFERFFERVTRRYERSLRWALAHRPTVLVFALLTIGLSAYFFLHLDREFLPDEDKGRLLCLSITPQGSTPEYTDRMMRQMEEIVRDTAEVNTYFTAVALPFNGPGDASLGFMFVRLQDGERRHVRDIVGGPAGLGFRFFNDVEGAIAVPITPKAVDLSFGQPYNLVLMHPHLDELLAYTDQLLGELRQAGFLANARATVEMTKPELQVHIDRDRAGALGVSVSDLARALQILFGGRDLSDFKREGKQYEVIAQVERGARLTPADLERVFVRGADGKQVQLSNVVTLDAGAGPNRIERFNRQRAVTIEGTPVGMPIGSAVDLTQAILKRTLPDDFTYDWKGEARDLRESSRDIYLFMLLAVLVVYMVLAAQFESFVHPFTVLVALPLSFVGAFGLLYALNWWDFGGTILYAMNHYRPDPPGFAKTLGAVVHRIPSMNMNIFSQVGLILLIGLVTKNSILLVDFANQHRARGLGVREAMVQAGLLRLRPILMTSFATIAGILPIAIGFGDAAESRRPLGVTAVGGMISSTFLTLLVIPVIYTLFADLGEGRRRPNGAASAPPADGAPGA